MGDFTRVKSPMKIHGRFYLSKKTPDYKMTHQLFTLFWIISNILTFHFYTFSVICTFYFYIAFEELTFYQKCSIKCVLYSLFYTRKVIFIQLQEFPTPPYCCCCSVTKRSDSSVAQALKALKCIFETPHNEIKCVLSIIESYSSEKNGSKFSHLLTVRTAGAAPPRAPSPPPPLRSAWP